MRIKIREKKNYDDGGDLDEWTTESANYNYGFKVFDFKVFCGEKTAFVIAKSEKSFDFPSIF